MKSLLKVTKPASDSGDGNKKKFCQMACGKLFGVTVKFAGYFFSC